MSHHMTSLAMKQSGLKPATKIVLYWLADHHNSETGRCFPSLKRLCERTEMGKTALTEHLILLEQMGLITRIRRKKPDGGWTSTSYTLNLLDQSTRKTDNPYSETERPLVREADTNLGNNNLGNINNKIIKDDRFDDFWAVVCRKVGKGQARKAWKAATKKADADRLISAMRAFTKSCEGKDEQYIPHPATWLNGERWDDQSSSTQSSNSDRPQMTREEAEAYLKRRNEEFAAKMRQGHIDRAKALN